VDRFKRFNDTFGHAAGDEVLRKVGRLLKTGTRHGDIACRYGGEEFVLALPETSLEPAIRKAERLCRKMGETRLAKEGRPLGRVTLSAGVAAFPDHGSSPAEILKAADRALYRAKRGGRDRAALAR